MSLNNRAGVFEGCCTAACYVDGNGDRHVFNRKGLYTIDPSSGQVVPFGELVEDDNGMLVDLDDYKPTPCDVERSACGFRMPDGHWWLTSADDEFIADNCNVSYRFTSFIVNGTQKITSPVGFTLNNGNINFVTVGANATYTNMVDFLNTWAAANCPDYEFVVPNISDDASYGVFGIIAPDGDTFSIELRKSMCGGGNQQYEWRNGGVALWDGNEETNYNGFKCASEQVWYDEGILS